MSDAPAEERAAEPRRPRFAFAGRPEKVLGLALLAVALLGIVAILLGLLLWPDGTDGGSRRASGPLAGRQNATLDVDDGIGAVRVRAADMDDLYRITVPAGSGVRPRVDRDDGEVRLHLAPANNGNNDPGTVDITVNKGVAWILRINGGTRQTVIDMSGGKLDEIDLGGGSSQVELTLPAPSRVVPVRMTAGVDQFAVRLPVNTPVRVTFGSGAGRATLDGTTHQGIGPGSSFTANGWGQTNTGIDIQAQAGVGSLSVDQIQ